MPSPIRSRDADSSQTEKQTDVEVGVPSDVSEYEDQLREAAPKLRGRQLTAALAFVAGTGFTLFGCVERTYSSFRTSRLM